MKSLISSRAITRSCMFPYRLDYIFILFRISPVSLHLEVLADKAIVVELFPYPQKGLRNSAADFPIHFFSNLHVYFFKLRCGKVTLRRSQQLRGISANCYQLVRPCYCISIICIFFPGIENLSV